MLYDTVTTTTESDMHGEPCRSCDQPSVTNIHIVNEDGNGETVHTCAAAECITAAIAARHHGHAEVLVEISTAPTDQTDAAAVAA